MGKKSKKKAATGKTKMGRPPAAEPRDRFVGVKYTAAEHDRVSAAALAAGRDLSSFIRERSLEGL